MIRIWLLVFLQVVSGILVSAVKNVMLVNVLKSGYAATKPWHWFILIESLKNKETKPHNNLKQRCHGANIIRVLILYLNPCLPHLSLVPRNHGHNTIFGGTDIDIELGNTADEAKDDPGKHNTFDRDNRQHPPSQQSGELERWWTSHICYGRNENDSQLLQCCCCGKDIIVARCVLIGLSPGGDTWHLATSV